MIILRIVKTDQKDLAKREVRLKTALAFPSGYSLLQFLKSRIWRKKGEERTRRGRRVLSILV